MHIVYLGLGANIGNRKRTIHEAIEKMENLGIYEVAPEDFALIDYVNTSKIEAQEIIRVGLDRMITEVG